MLGFGARQQEMLAANAAKRAQLEADLKQQIAEKQARRVGYVPSSAHVMVLSVKRAQLRT